MIEFDFLRIKMENLSFKDIRYVTYFNSIYNIRNKFIKLSFKIHTITWGLGFRV